MNTCDRFAPERFLTGEQIQSLSLERAAEYCDFILFKPVHLPSGTSLVSGTMRCENNSGVVHNHRFEGASYRLEYQNSGARFSVKQFCYYWAPPAYDYPCLWMNSAITNVNIATPPVPQFIGDNVLWIGTDFRGRCAATITLQRTTVELTMIEGELSHKDIARIFKNLEIVDVHQAEEMRRLTFAEHCYLGRHTNATPTRVPTCYWDHQRIEEGRMLAFSANSGWPTLPFSVPDLSTLGYELDTLFICGDKNAPFEVELRYEHSKSFGHEIRILFTPSHSVNPIQYPPTLDNQPCTQEQFTTQNGSIAYLASSVHGDIGAHAAVMKATKTDGTYILIAKPAPWTTKKWMRDFCEYMSRTL